MHGQVTAAVSIKGQGKGKGKGHPNWTVYMQAIIHETDLEGDVVTEATGGMSRTYLVTTRGHPVVTTEYEVTASLDRDSERLVVNVTETEQPDEDQDDGPPPDSPDRPVPPSPDGPPDLGPSAAEDRGYWVDPNTR